MQPLHQICKQTHSEYFERTMTQSSPSTYNLTSPNYSVIQKEDNNTISSLSFEVIDEIISNIEHEALQNNLKEKNLQVKALEKCVHGQATEINELRVGIIDRDKKIENLTQKNENLTQKNENLTQKNEGLTQKNEGLTQNGRVKDWKIEHLTDKVEGIAIDSLQEGIARSQLQKSNAEREASEAQRSAWKNTIVSGVGINVGLGIILAGSGPVGIVGAAVLGTVTAIKGARKHDELQEKERIAKEEKTKRDISIERKTQELNRIQNRQ